MSFPCVETNTLTNRHTKRVKIVNREKYKCILPLILTLSLFLCSSTNRNGEPCAHSSVASDLIIYCVWHALTFIGVDISFEPSHTRTHAVDVVDRQFHYSKMTPKRRTNRPTDASNNDQFSFALIYLLILVVG